MTMWLGRVRFVAAGLVLGGLALLPGCGGGSRPASIVLVVVDTLRADFLGSYGFGGPISPNLDRLAEDAVVFERAYAPSPWTKPSMASLFTSLYPQVHGITNHEGSFWGGDENEEVRIGVLSDRATTLAEALQAEGYETAGFVTNPWLKADYGFGQGFDLYDDSISDRYTEEIEAAPANEIASAAISWLRGREDDRPFFLYLHLMDVHTPYALHAERSDYDALVGAPQVRSDVQMEESQAFHQTFYNVEQKPEWATDEMRRTVAYWRTRYAAGVRGMDHDLSEFLDHLESAGHLEDSYFVLTSDHGEELFEHGSWSHGQNLFFHQLHVPLFVRPPGGLAGGRRVPDIVELMDVMPTLMTLGGAPSIPQTQGQDLSGFLQGGTPEVRGEAFATATQPYPMLHAMQTADHKLIMDIETRNGWLFDSIADPLEQLNRAGTPDWEKVASQMQFQLTNHVGDSLANGTLTSETTEIPEEMLERLRALGYVR